MCQFYYVQDIKLPFPRFLIINLYGLNECKAAACFLRWLDFALMDLLNTSFSSIKIDSPDRRAHDILTKLQQAGLFRALVIGSDGNRVLLDTAFGQLRGLAPENLAKGDEIVARLLPGKTDPTIKIEHLQLAKQTLPQKILKQLINRATPASPRIIKVISHSTDQTLIQQGDKTYTIPRQNQLKAGDTFFMTASADNKVLLSRIQPETILKNALSRLLPRITWGEDGSGLTALQKVVNNILQLKPTATPGQANPSLLTELEKPAFQATPQQNSPISQHETSARDIQQLLTSLSRTQLTADSLKAQPLRQILSMLTLVKPDASMDSESSHLSIPRQLNELLNALRNSPEDFNVLLRQIINTHAGGTKTSTEDTHLPDSVNLLKSELLQQIEQTQTQLLVQKTTLRLHQEQNLPLQINLNIPVQIDNETTALKLGIKQRNGGDLTEEQHWEINLSFEFGLLGLISTHLVLRDIKLSAHFWAVEPGTKGLIDTHLDQFKDQLRKSGFELGQFDSFIGKPASVNEVSYPLSENLVDIKV